MESKARAVAEAARAAAGEKLALTASELRVCRGRLEQIEGAHSG